MIEHYYYSLPLTNKTTDLATVYSAGVYYIYISYQLGVDWLQVTGCLDNYVNVGGLDIDFNGLCVSFKEFSCETALSTFGIVIHSKRSSQQRHALWCQDMYT